jgi:hypothetical protein
MFKSKYIYVKLTAKWGGFQVGDVIRFGRSKGLVRIEAGDGIEVKKQAAVNDPVKEPVVESAIATPKAEKAVVNRTPSANAKEDIKAMADAVEVQPRVKKGRQKDVRK